MQSNLLTKSHVKSPCPLVPALWLVVPICLILIRAQADTSFRHGERSIKEHLEHTFITVHSWLTCKTPVFVLVQPLIWVGKESAPTNSSWNTHSQKWHRAVNSGSSRPCQMGHKSQELTGALLVSCMQGVPWCGAAGRKRAWWVASLWFQWK